MELKQRGPSGVSGARLTGRQNHLFCFLLLFIVFAFYRFYRFAFYRFASVMPLFLRSILGDFFVFLGERPDWTINWILSQRHTKAERDYIRLTLEITTDKPAVAWAV